MKSKFFTVSALLYLLVQVSAFSQDGYILVVGSSENDSTVIQVLTDEGYTVERGLDYSGELSADKLEMVNGADLVIFSRNGASGGHGEAEAVMQQWADVEAPILSLSPWIMRNSRWRWINSTALSCHGSDSIGIPGDAQEHPIYEGVDVSTGLLEVIVAGTTRNEKFVIDDGGTAIDVGTGVLLATDPSDDGIMAAEWFAGDVFYLGGDIASPIANSNRMWLGFVTEGDNCPQEGNVMSAFNGNDAGKTIFLNAVAYMKVTPPESTVTLRNNELKIFPNPAVNLLTIRGLDKEVSYQVLDITGSVILSGHTLDNIDISGLQSGMYILRIDNDLSAKFVKQ